MSSGEAPLAVKLDCWPASLPAMLTRSTSTPGTVFSTAQGSRPCGTCVSSSLVSVVEVPTFFVSTTGVSSVTVTLSARPATFRAEAEVHVRARVHDDVARDGAEVRQGHAEPVGARVEVQEAELALRARNGRAGAADRDARQGDRRAGKAGARLVGHRPVDVAPGGLRLGHGRRRQCEPCREGAERPRARTIASSVIPPIQDRPTVTSKYAAIKDLDRTLRKERTTRATRGPLSAAQQVSHPADRHGTRPIRPGGSGMPKSRPIGSPRTCVV